MPKSDAVEKRIGPISGNTRNQIWMCPSLSIYSNSEYVYAIPPTAVALFWRKGGRGISESKPLSMIFAILSHILNTTDVNNYSVRTTGGCSFEDTMAKGSFPLAPLEGWGRSHSGSNPRSVGEDAPKTFYGSLFALALVTLRFKRMSWGGGGARSRKFA